MIARFLTIKITEPDLRKPGPHCPPPVLEFARAQPCYEGMDDMGAYAEARGREFLEGMLVVECPEADHV